MNVALDTMLLSFTLQVISPSHPLCLPTPPFYVTLWSVSLCPYVAGSEGPQGIDWALLNAVRLMGDM